MINWSIKRQLYLLSGSLMILAAAASLIGFFDAYILSKSLDDVNKISLPAVRAMGAADMMHDSIRSIVYRAFYLSETSDEMVKREIRLELNDAIARFNKELETILNLPMNSEIHDLIKKVEPPVKYYTSVANEAVSAALSGQKAQSVSKLADVEKGFEVLEVDLGKLGDSIEQDAKLIEKESNEISSLMMRISAALVLFGTLFGTLISVSIVRRMMKTLSHVISRLDSSSQALTKSSVQSAESATELSEASTEQAASLQETMASLEEISAMVTQNAESASKVNTAVITNQKASEEGTQSVVEMLRAINEIKATNDEVLAQMEASNEEFSEIVKIITEIGDKTKVINDIVFQTKLLSFNASVEAARAGEHGKGFAVVAEEVGNLAQMSGNAAKQIGDMLTNSVKKVNGIVEQTTHRVGQLLEIGKDKVTMGQATAQRCKEALERMAENARMVSTMVAEITNASNEQAQGIQEISKAVSQLDQATQQNAGVAQQTSSQADHLKKESAMLAESVHQLVLFVGRSSESSKPSGNDSRNVIPFDKRKISTHGSSNRTAKVQRASGADFVPDGSDPGFKES